MIAPNGIIREDSEWDSEENEQDVTETITLDGTISDATLHVSASGSFVGPGVDPHNLHFGNSPDSDIAWEGSTLDTTPTVVDQRPIVFESTDNWMYTFIFALSWFMAPVLIVWSKITGKPAGIRVPKFKWFRRRPR